MKEKSPYYGVDCLSMVNLTFFSISYILLGWNEYENLERLWNI